MDTTSIKAAAREYGKTLHWIIYEVMSKRARELAALAIFLMLASVIFMTGAVYLIRLVVNALTNNDTERAVFVLVAGTGSLLVCGQLLLTWHDLAREKLWNDNFKNTAVVLTQLYFARSVEELSSETNGVGAEQVESGKERIRTLFQLVFFETTSIAAVFISSLLWASFIDWKAGTAICLLIAFNISWFGWINGKLARTCQKIDAAFRRSNARLVERGHSMLSVKTLGAEAIACDLARKEISSPLQADLFVWTNYNWIDLRRSLVNIAVILTLLVYGVRYASWQAGDVAALCACLFSVNEKFGHVGHLMRQFAGEIARLKALRDHLTSKPAFDNNAGIIYERKD